MVLIFDLDDTLYDEMSFVRSGFTAVSNWGYLQFGKDADESFHFMMEILERNGRGQVFDRWLDECLGRKSKSLTSKALSIYRTHKPIIKISDIIFRLLEGLSNYPLYIVTDGNKFVQNNKIKELQISKYFKKVYITHRYGVKNAKPSLYCFEKIMMRENCSWSELVYIGDNPAKDFLNLNLKGANTVRVLTGGHKDEIAREGYEAKYIIQDIVDFPALIEVIKKNT
jgi:putative hydrolase of the HAD superfamily